MPVGAPPCVTANGRINPSVGSTNVRIGASVGPEKPVPKEVDHSEIAVRVQMVDEVKLLLTLEPAETS